MFSDRSRHLDLDSLHQTDNQSVISNLQSPIPGIPDWRRFGDAWGAHYGEEHVVGRHLEFTGAIGAEAAVRFIGSASAPSAG